MSCRIYATGAGSDMNCALYHLRIDLFVMQYLLVMRRKFHSFEFLSRDDSHEAKEALLILRTKNCHSNISAIKV